MRITKLHLILFAIIALVLGFYVYQIQQEHQRLRELEIARQAREEERARLETEYRRREAEEKKKRDEALQAVAVAGEYWKTALKEGRDVTKGQATLHQAKDVLCQLDFDEATILARRAIDELRSAPVKRLYYRVRRGDNLWKIAKMRRHYGRGSMWPVIWRANQKKIPDFDAIEPQMTLLIPKRRK